MRHVRTFPRNRCEADVIINKLLICKLASVNGKLKIMSSFHTARVLATDKCYKIKELSQLNSTDVCLAKRKVNSVNKRSTLIEEHDKRCWLLMMYTNIIFATKN